MLFKGRKPYYAKVGRRGGISKQKWMWFMGFYECTFIVRQDVSIQEANRVADRFANMVVSGGGQVVKKEYWGLRTLAYEIKKNKKGHYVMLGIKAEPAIVKELERTLKINEDIIKYLTVKCDTLDDKPSFMMQNPQSYDEESYASRDMQY
jgi:small subunit ribosomal protein S6